MLRTTIAPVVHQAGMESVAEGWLREADAFCSAAGERALQRLVRRTLASVGAKVPKGSTSAVPPHLARLGITARETDSAACQRRPEQCRHLPSPVHIDQNRGVPRQQHAAKDRPDQPGTVAVSQYR